MFSARIFSFFFLLSTLGLFVCAKPVAVDTSDLAIRSGADLATRGSPCGCGEDIITILADLKISVSAQVLLLDGVAPPSGPCNAIIVAIKAAVALCADVVITTPITTIQLNIIAGLIVDIILLVANGCAKYGLLVILTLCLALDVQLAAIVNACVTLCVDLDLVAQLSVLLDVDVTLLLDVKFLLTLAACGLGL